MLLEVNEDDLMIANVKEYKAKIMLSKTMHFDDIIAHSKPFGYLYELSF